MSYGMGPNKLATRLGIPIEKARAYLAAIKKTIHRSTTYKQYIPDFAAKYSSKAFSTLDGFICRYNALDANHTTITNWPFQSGGSMILKYLVHNLMTEYRNGNLDAIILATIHDAAVFLVDEGDYATIEKISNMMKDAANKILNAPNGWSIKVGSPDIIKNGDIWCTDNAQFVEQFKELLNFKS
jgi:DNA polymerase I-like protein with 3'-5' exonuclease and polymerase domains